MTPASNGYQVEYDLFIDNILTPYAVSLKINNGNDYNNFINGYGEESFILFCEGINSKIKKIENLSSDQEVKFLIKRMYSLVSEVRTKKVTLEVILSI